MIHTVAYARLSLKCPLLHALEHITVLSRTIESIWIPTVAYARHFLSRNNIACFQCLFVVRFRLVYEFSVCVLYALYCCIVAKVDATQFISMVSVQFIHYKCNFWQWINAFAPLPRGSNRLSTSTSTVSAIRRTKHMLHFKRAKIYTVATKK